MEFKLTKVCSNKVQKRSAFIDRILFIAHRQNTHTISDISIFSGIPASTNGGIMHTFGQQVCKLTSAMTTISES